MHSSLRGRPPSGVSPRGRNRRGAWAAPKRGERCLDPGRVHELMRPLAHAPVEEFHVVLLDVRGRLIRTERIAQGSVSQCPVSPRDTLRVAVREGAHGIVFVHNHPSGDASPSADDAGLTERLRAASELVGVMARDHVIVATVATTPSSRRDAGVDEGKASRCARTKRDELVLGGRRSLRERTAHTTRAEAAVRSSPPPRPRRTGREAACWSFLSRSRHSPQEQDSAAELGVVACRTPASAVGGDGFEPALQELEDVLDRGAVNVASADRCHVTRRSREAPEPGSARGGGGLEPHQVHGLATRAFRRPLAAQCSGGEDRRVAYDAHTGGKARRQRAG